jgi:hypothetical protein
MPIGLSLGGDAREAGRHGAGAPVTIALEHDFGLRAGLPERSGPENLAGVLK